MRLGGPLVTGRAAWPALSATLLALLGVLGVLALTGAGTPPGGYSLRAAPASVTLAAGGRANLTVLLDVRGNFTGTVSLVPSGVPAGITLALSRSTVPLDRHRPTAVVIGRLTGSPAAAAGSFTLNILAVAGRERQISLVQLKVQRPASTRQISPPATVPFVLYTRPPVVTLDAVSARRPITGTTNDRRDPVLVWIYRAGKPVRTLTTQPGPDGRWRVLLPKLPPGRYLALAGQLDTAGKLGRSLRRPFTVPAAKRR